MKTLIDKVVTVVELDNGVVFERFDAWDGGGTSFEDIKQYIHDSKGRCVVRRRQYLVLDNGVEVDVSIQEVLNILPDRTGVFVVFEKEPYNFSGSENSWFFGYPSNAAIFNADGTLRFQMHNPYGENSYIGAIHSGAMPDHPDTLGVLIGTVGHEPEWLYLVDPNAPKLIPTGKWIRY
ncbi:hypothetical protein JFT81_07375 [Pseudomonas sp. TH43]|uniref:hypothetical protein n=1 Tax=Pseudomonas sp. TH43 TaxID=2796407 RepID=UPI0019115A0E|nr:hypothetical protein [Pseudomonas sp. TH43]MBK5374450.1 hypothetical protein [Pseudomonas sp. TH43]